MIHVMLKQYSIVTWFVVFTPLPEDQIVSNTIGQLMFTLCVSFNRSFLFIFNAAAITVKISQSEYPLGLCLFEKLYLYCSSLTKSLKSHFLVIVAP